MSALDNVQIDERPMIGRSLTAMMEMRFRCCGFRLFFD